MTYDARPVPGRYWAIGGVIALLVAVTSYDEIASLVPHSSFAFGLLWPLATVLSLVVLAISVSPPLLALMSPWAGVALGAFWLLPVLVGSSYLSGYVILLGVALLAPWHSWAAGLTAAGLAFASIAAGILHSGRVLFPFASVNPLDWYVSGVLDGIGYLLVWLVPVLLVVGAAWLLRRTTEDSLAGRQAVARTVQVEEQSAVTAERARLARDLHDVVAHHVSLIAVRAETAPYTQPNLGDEARAVLREIAGDARLALDELRGVLGILNRSGAGADRSPQPGLAELPALVERTRSAGTEVRLNGDVGVSVPPSVGYVAYRVVQEALTNARRHAPGSAVDLTLDASAGMLVVAVANPLGTGSAPGSGHGLAGMRERVEALGGHLEVGAQAGWFVVRATLPRREPR